MVDWHYLVPIEGKIEKRKSKGPGYHKPHRGRPGKRGGSLPRNGTTKKKGMGKIIAPITVSLWNKKIKLTKMGMVPVKELPPPRKGCKRLYHTTGRSSDLPNIERKGLLVSEATGYEAPTDILWATNAPGAYSENRGLIVIDVPKGNVEKVNVTDYMIRGGVPAKDIIATYPMVTYDKRGRAEARRWDKLIDTRRKFGLKRILPVVTEEIAELLKQVPDKS